MGSGYREEDPEARREREQDRADEEHAREAIDHAIDASKKDRLKTRLGVTPRGAVDVVLTGAGALAVGAGAFALTGQILAAAIGGGLIVGLRAFLRLQDRIEPTKNPPKRSDRSF